MFCQRFCIWSRIQYAKDNTSCVIKFKTPRKGDKWRLSVRSRGTTVTIQKVLKIHVKGNLMFIGPCIIVILEEWETNLMSLAIFISRQNTSHQTHTTIHRKFTLPLNHPSLQNKTTDVVIQQHSRKLLMMDILMSETCWAHKKWHKIASDIKLVFRSSTITMMHGPINIKIKQLQGTELWYTYYIWYIYIYINMRVWSYTLGSLYLRFKFWLEIFNIETVTKKSWNQ